MSFRQFVQRALSVSVILLGVNVLYYIYQFILNHSLSREAYGLMGQLISITLVGALPSIAISLFITRYITLYGEGEREKAEHIIVVVFRKMLTVLGIFGGVLLILTPFFSPWLGVSSVLYVLVVLTVMISIVLNYIRAAIYAQHQLWKYAINMILETILRITITATVFVYTRDTTVAYSIFFLSIFFSTVFFFQEVRSWLSQKSTPAMLNIDTSEMRTQIIPMASISVFLALVGNVEILLAGRLLDAVSTGMMTALMLIGKLVLVVLSMVVSIGFPYFANSRKHKVFLRWLYIAMVGITLLMIAFFYFFGSWIISILLAPEYVILAPFVFRFTLSIIIVAWISLLIQHLSLAGYKRIGYLSPLIYIVLIVSILTQSRTFEGFINGMLVGYTIGFLMLFGVFYGIQVWRE